MKNITISPSIIHLIHLLSFFDNKDICVVHTCSLFIYDLSIFLAIVNDVYGINSS